MLEIEKDRSVGGRYEVVACVERYRMKNSLIKQKRTDTYTLMSHGMTACRLYRVRSLSAFHASRGGQRPVERYCECYGKVCGP